MARSLVRSLFADTFGAKSLLSIPLNVSGRWIGEIIALFSPTTGVSERELPSDVALRAGQRSRSKACACSINQKTNEELLADEPDDQRSQPKRSNFSTPEAL